MLINKLFFFGCCFLSGWKNTNKSLYRIPFFLSLRFFFLQEVLDFKCDRMTLTNRTNSCVPCSLIL